MNTLVIVFALCIFFVIFISYCAASLNKRVIHKDEITKLIDLDYPKSIVLNKGDEFPDIDFPVVMKPCVKSHKSLHVELVRSREQAENYINNFDWRLNDKILVQEFCKGKNDGTVMYFKDPICGKDKIGFISRVIFFTENKLGSKNRISRDKKLKFIQIDDTENLLTEKNKDVFMKIFRKLPEIGEARMDIIWETDEKLKNGEFCVVEINTYGGDTRVAVLSEFNNHMDELNKYKDQIIPVKSNFHDKLNDIRRFSTMGARNVAIGKGSTMQEYLSFIYHIINRYGYFYLNEKGIL